MCQFYVHNMIVYGDSKIYCSNVKTLRFLEKLRFASAIFLALQLRSQATDCFHFFTAAQLHIDILISDLNFHKMRNVLGFRSVGYIYSKL